MVIASVHSVHHLDVQVDAIFVSRPNIWKFNICVGIDLYLSVVDKDMSANIEQKIMPKIAEKTVAVIGVAFRCAVAFVALLLAVAGFLEDKFAMALLANALLVAMLLPQAAVPILTMKARVAVAVLLFSALVFVQ